MFFECSLKCSISCSLSFLSGLSELWVWSAKGFGFYATFGRWTLALTLSFAPFGHSGRKIHNIWGRYASQVSSLSVPSPRPITDRFRRLGFPRLPLLDHILFLIQLHCKYSTILSWIIFYTFKVKFYLLIIQPSKLNSLRQPIAIRFSTGQNSFLTPVRKETKVWKVNPLWGENPTKTGWTKRWGSNQLNSEEQYDST